MKICKREKGGYYFKTKPNDKQAPQMRKRFENFEEKNVNREQNKNKSTQYINYSKLLIYFLNNMLQGMIEHVRNNTATCFKPRLN